MLEKNPIHFVTIAHKEISYWALILEIYSYGLQLVLKVKTYGRSMYKLMP